MKNNGGTDKKFFKRIRGDYAYRTLIFAVLSTVINVVFAGFNLILGIYYSSAWSIGIAAYYALLITIRAYTAVCELKFRKKRLSEEEKIPARKTPFLIQCTLLLVVDIALIAPISLMVMQKKPINFSIIPAIAMAAYTTYKIVTSSVNFAKTRKSQNLSVKTFRIINFVDALVSLLSLQYALIMTQEGSIEGEMLTLCAISSFAIWTAVIVISIISLRYAIKIRRSKL